MSNNRKKPSIFLGCLLNFLWPGIGHIYFGNIKRGLVFAALGLFLPGIMFIIACVDLYFMSKGSYPSVGTGQMPNVDINMDKVYSVLKTVIIAVICFYLVMVLIVGIWIVNSRKSKADICVTEMRRISTELDEYLSKHGVYPESLKKLVGMRAPRREWLRDPWGSQYIYINKGGSFKLASSGRDRSPNTPDDIILE